MRIPFKNSEEEKKIGKIYNGNEIIAIGPCRGVGDVVNVNGSTAAAGNSH